MKRILFLLSIMMFFAMNIQAQKVEVNLSDLTPAQRAKIEAQQKLDVANQQILNLEKKIDTYGKWIGVGGEIGNAVNEGLTAVVDVADKFGKTDVGRFTMVLIAWKVMGKDVIQIFLGLIFFAVLTTILVRVYKRTVTTRKVLIERTSNGFFQRPTKKYETVESKLDGDQATWLCIGIIVAFLLGIWITYGIMF